MAEEEKNSDAVLIAAYRSGNQRALEELFERYRRPLYAYFNRMTGGDTMAADDMFQEVWVKVLRYLPNYRESGRFSAWLFQIAANQFRTAYRRRRNWLKFFTPAGDEEATPETADDAAPVWHEMDENGRRRKLEQALEQLPPEQREVFHWRQNDLSFKEIAEIQKCPLNTALGRMNLAMKSLRRCCHDDM